MLPFFQWCYGTWIGETIRESTWLFPLIEAFHLVGLGLTAGTVLTVDLRLFGVGLSRQSAPQLLASAQPWFLGSVSLMVVTGILLAWAATRTARDSDRDARLPHREVCGECVLRLVRGPQIAPHLFQSHRSLSRARSRHASLSGDPQRVRLAARRMERSSAIS